MEDLLKYFIAETNKRFDQIEKKIDKLMTLRAQMLLIAGVSSAIVSSIASVLLTKVLK